MHYDSDKDRQKKRREEAMVGHPKKGDGTERDEYPYASTFEGGQGANKAVVAYVPKNEQRIQGGELGSLYGTLNQGEAFLVLPVPKDTEPDDKPMQGVGVNTNQNQGTGNNTRGNDGTVIQMTPPINERSIETAAAAAIIGYWIFRTVRAAATWECGGCGAWAF